MKNLILINSIKIVTALMIFTLISCEKTEDLVSNEVSGT